MLVNTDGVVTETHADSILLDFAHLGGEFYLILNVLIQVISINRASQWLIVHVVVIVVVIVKAEHRAIVC